VVISPAAYSSQPPWGSETAATAPNTAKRVTAELAAERNRFVAAPGKKTEAPALGLLASGKPVYTFSGRPGPLLDAGARLVTSDFFSTRAAMPPTA
jgi:hypothetical protein